MDLFQIAMLVWPIVASLQLASTTRDAMRAGLWSAVAGSAALVVLAGWSSQVVAQKSTKSPTSQEYINHVGGRLIPAGELELDGRRMACGNHPTVTKLIDYEQFCGITPAVKAADSGRVPAELEITVGQLKDRLDRRDVYLLDVREPREYDICHIEGSTLIPLGELPKRFTELPRGADSPDIVVHCKSGIRSAKAVNFLKQQGFDRVQNLRGGILEWIARIDPELPTY